MSLTVEVAAISDVGCVRKNNEDNLGYDSRYGIYVVCDGMGGQAAGEVASKMAVDTVLTYFREGSKSGVYPQIGDGSDDCRGAGGEGIHLHRARGRQPHLSRPRRSDPAAYARPLAGHGAGT